MKIITKDSKETISFGKKIAKTLKGGEVLLLIGDLGSGKTTFAKGIAEGLGVKEMVNSPTFVIMKIYQTQSSKHKAQNKLKIQSSKLKTFAKDGSVVGGQSKLKIQNSKFKGVNVTAPYLLSPAPLFFVHIDTYRGIDTMGFDKTELLTQMLRQTGALEYFGRNDSVCLVEWGARLEEYLRKKKIKTTMIKINIDGENKRTFNIK